MITFNFMLKSGFNKLMSKLWSWSIALAILGGVFMVNGWPYGNIILSIAGIVLVLIYFLSGFKPLPEKTDWTLVFPELAGIFPDDESELTSPIIKMKQLRKEVEDLKKEIEELKNSQ